MSYCINRAVSISPFDPFSGFARPAEVPAVRGRRHMSDTTPRQARYVRKVLFCRQASCIGIAYASKRDQNRKWRFTLV